MARQGDAFRPQPADSKPGSFYPIKVAEYPKFDKFDNTMILWDAPLYEDMRPGALYVVTINGIGEFTFAGVKFLCPCGCGFSVWLPQEFEGNKGNGWNIVINGLKGVTIGDADGNAVSGYSVGNQNVCGAHFFIVNSEVRWL